MGETKYSNFAWHTTVDISTAKIQQKQQENTSAYLGIAFQISVLQYWKKLEGMTNFTEEKGRNILSENSTLFTMG